MKSRAFVAALIATTMLAGSGAAVYAADNAAANQVQTASATQNDEATAKDFLKLSDDGLSAVKNVHAARVAIYNGDTEAAAKFVKAAQGFTSTAQKDATQLEKLAGSKAAGDTDAMMIPISASLSVDQEYALHPSDAGRLVKANAALKAGDNAAAKEQASMIDEGVSYTFAALPYDNLNNGLNEASQKISSGDFHAANMALKQIEDSVIIDQVSMFMDPETAPANS